MSPEAQRIAIAEACGWRDCHESESWMATIGTLHELDSDQYAVLPDYLNDLNAMNSAVLQKFNGPAPDGWAFIDNLRVACGIPHSSTCMALVCATAPQRAEAFLRTIGKWEEASK
jgi:hypothetical protein